MYCSKCGKNIVGDYKFCPECGAQTPFKKADSGPAGRKSGTAGFVLGLVSIMSFILLRFLDNLIVDNIITIPLLCIFIASSITGLVFSIISIRKRKNWKPILGIVFNCFIPVFTICTAIPVVSLNIRSASTESVIPLIYEVASERKDQQVQTFHKFLESRNSDFIVLDTTGVDSIEIHASVPSEYGQLKFDIVPDYKELQNFTEDSTNGAYGHYSGFDYLGHNYSKKFTSCYGQKVYFVFKNRNFVFDSSVDITITYKYK